MFKYTVITQTVNIEGGVASSITQKDTLKEAEDLYFDTLSKVGGNPATKDLRVELKDTSGMGIKVEIRHNEPKENSFVE